MIAAKAEHRCSKAAEDASMSEDDSKNPKPPPQLPPEPPAPLPPLIEPPRPKYPMPPGNPKGSRYPPIPPPPVRPISEPPSPTLPTWEIGEPKKEPARPDEEPLLTPMPLHTPEKDKK